MPWDFWLIFVVLGVVVPWRGRARVRRLMEQPVPTTAEKLVLYATTIAFQWLLTGLIAWRAVARGLTATELGLAGKPGAGSWLLAICGCATICALQWGNLKRMGKSDSPSAERMRSLGERLLPRSAVELLPFFALAITAGVCEEFLYRGFAMAALQRAGLGTWLSVLMTSVLFGLAHLYQGRAGIVGTGLVGLLFGSVRALGSTLGPLAVWHAGLDVVAGVAGAKYLTTAPKTAEVTPNQKITG